MANQHIMLDCRPYGLALTLSITLQAGVMIELEFVEPAQPSKFDSNDVQQLHVVRQLQQYLLGQCEEFDIPMKVAGSDFQLRVWKLLQSIPYGEVRSYGQLATQLSSSARAVGGACRNNPLPLLIPCHRVVAAKGIGGFAGDAAGGRVSIKEWLLSHEQD